MFDFIPSLRELLQSKGILEEFLVILSDPNCSSIVEDEPPMYIIDVAIRWDGANARYKKIDWLELSDEWFSLCTHTTPVTCTQKELADLLSKPTKARLLDALHNRI